MYELEDHDYENFDYGYDNEEKEEAYYEHEEVVKKWRKHLGWKRCFWMDLHRYFERICTRQIAKYYKTKIWTSP